ncbi:MAG: G1 family glutamic endopeptidase, partial [Chloroflexota bacterium]
MVLASGVLAAPDAGTSTTSTNWAGHAVQASPGNSFNFVTASWVEPAMAVACGSAGTNPSLATFSVGFDGYNNGTHEHVGTAILCAGPPGGAMFKETAYYETCLGFHCTTVRLGPAFPLMAGDHIMAAAYFADGKYTFVLHNTRTG